MSSAAASDLAADSAAEAAPARFPDNDTVGAALLSYLLLKLIHSPLPIATSLLGNVSFSRLDPHLPQIATPPADAQLIVTAVISAIDYLKKDQHAAALRCFQIAANSYIEMLEAGHISEAGGAFKVSIGLLKEAVASINLLPLFSTVVGAVVYAEKKQLPTFAHTDRVTVTAQTDGAYSDLIHALVQMVRPPRLPEYQDGFLRINDATTLESALSVLRDDGYHVFAKRLPDDIIGQLVEFSAHAPGCAVPANPDLTKIDLGNADADGFQVSAQATLDNLVIQDILCDPSFLTVATSHFGCTPVLGHVLLRWTLPTARPASDDLAQYFHWDDDWIRWLKFFVYLTDVDEDSGPHIYVRGTHRRGSKPRHLLDRGYARIPDSDITSTYPAQDIISVTAPRGTIFAADTRCWHKGLQPKINRRLILQLNFADTLAMGPPLAPALVIRRCHSERFRRFVAKNRSVFPEPYYVVEEGAL